MAITGGPISELRLGTILGHELIFVPYLSGFHADTEEENCIFHL